MTASQYGIGRIKEHPDNCKQEEGPDIVINLNCPEEETPQGTPKKALRRGRHDLLHLSKKSKGQ